MTVWYKILVSEFAAVMSDMFQSLKYITGEFQELVWA